MDRTKEMVKLAYAALEDKKAKDITVLDIGKVTVIADYFIITGGANERQVKALADNVEDLVTAVSHTTHTEHSTRIGSDSQTGGDDIRDLSDTEGPLKSLRGFQSLSIGAGKTAEAQIQLSKESFEFWDAESNTMRTKPGEYEILYGTSSQPSDLKSIKVSIK